MKTTGSSLRRPLFCHTTLAAALLLAFGGAGAQDANSRADEIRKDLYTPDSSISVGLGHQSSDSRRFGQYRDQMDQGAYALLDLDLVRRDDATGTWLKLKGNNFGLRLDHERQGDWSYFLQGNRMSRSEPLIVNTGLQGIGSGMQTVKTTAPKRDVDLKVDHDIYALGTRKYMAGGFDVRISARQDEKKGDRMYGRGTGNAMEFLTEPIDHVTRQWEVVAGYAGRKLQLSGGYSGSAYDNNIPVLGVSGGAAAFATAPALDALALPPSNNAHQLHLSGGYNWSDSSRSSFKLSRAVAYQNTAFSPSFATRLAGSPESLNGKVATTLAFADLAMRPLQRLDITGVLRYENRDDQTPEEKYIANAGTSTSSAGITGFNKPRQLKQLKGTLEAGYQFSDGYRLVGALEQEDLTRNGSRDKIRVAYRENTAESTQRIEFKRTMSETLNGGVALVHSERTGSDYIRDTYINPEISNQLAALMWADRSRNKVRVSADWMPVDQWSLQFIADFSDDSYSGRALGPRQGKAQFFSGDASYRINEKWNLTTWLSREKISAKQSTQDAPATPVVVTRWDADLRDTNTAWGITLKGKPRANLELGADLSSSYDVAENTMSRVSGPGAVKSLPNFYYRQLSLKLFADYALARNSGIRVDVIVDRRRNNDWTWQNWVYADGTTVTNLPSENTAFVGVSYRYRWR